MKVKSSKVTEENLAHIKEIFIIHKKDAEDYIKGIQEAAQYFRENIEPIGLFEYVTNTMNSTTISTEERLLGCSLYEELNSIDLWPD
jgi:hypothetical protein